LFEDGGNRCIYGETFTKTFTKDLHHKDYFLLQNHHHDPDNSTETFHTAIMKDSTILSLLGGIFFEFGVLDGRNVESLRDVFRIDRSCDSAQCKGSKYEDECPLHFEMLRSNIGKSGFGVVVSTECEVIV
jgi:hypothetical protein